MSKRLTPIKIGHWGQFHMMYLPLYAALQTGYTKSLGLDIELVGMENDDVIFNQLIKGKIDFGFSDPIFVEIGRHKKQYAECVALVVKRAAIWGITHNPAIPPLQKVEDFVQLRIGSFPKPSTVYSLIEGLKQKHKRLLKNLQIVQAPMGQQAKLLSDNLADVVIELEPMVSLAEAKGMRAVLSVAEFYGDAAFTGLTATHKTIAEHPEIVAKMVKALQYGLDICLKDKKAALDVAQKIFPDYPADVLNHSIERLKSHGVWPKTTALDPKIWQAAIRLRQQIGDLPRK